MRSPLSCFSLLAALVSFCLSQNLNAKDFHCAPEASGAGDGSSRENALPMKQAEETLNNLMQPGDRLLLGSGVYEGLSLNISRGGAPDQPKTVMGIDTGNGLPVIRGTWSADKTTEGGTAIRLAAGTSHLTFKDFKVEGWVFCIYADESKEEPKTSSNLTFSNIDMREMRHGFYLADCSNLTIEDCELTRYSKHGFRFNGGCRDVTLRRCVADCSESDEEWEKKTELFPFGYIVNESKREQSGFTFEDCVARNNLMPLQKTKYKNGDGFVVEGSTTDVEFIRCRAFRNQDGGFDLKVKDVTMRDCVALENSRGFRIWAGGTLSNCLVGGGSTGVWSNGEKLTVERSTFFSLTNTAVLTDDRASDAVILKQCIIASSNTASRKTSKGKTILEETLITDMPGANAEVKFKGTPAEADSLRNKMDSVSHPGHGYRFPDAEKL